MDQPSGQYKWNLESGESHVVGSPASDRPVRETQGSLTGWGEERRKWQEWVEGGSPGPRGTPVTDMAWVRAVADRYGFSDLEIPVGSVVWEWDIKAIGGRCFYYPGGAWAIGLSLPRRQLEGQAASEQTLAHELVHAYLWEKHGVTGHGADFKAIARARGIAMYCPEFRCPGRGAPSPTVPRRAPGKCCSQVRLLRLSSGIQGGHLVWPPDLRLPGTFHRPRLSIGRGLGGTPGSNFVIADHEVDGRRPIFIITGTLGAIGIDPLAPSREGGGTTSC